jgi:hypothetical protein
MKFHTSKTLNQPNENNHFFDTDKVAIETAVMNEMNCNIYKIRNKARWKKSGCFFIDQIIRLQLADYWSQISNHLFICSHRCRAINIPIQS